MRIEQILEAIRAERRHQDELWGDDFDKKNTPNDWVTYMTHYLGQSVTLNFDNDTFRRNIFKVAALAVAVLERDYYAPRHYDFKNADGLRNPDYPSLNGLCINETESFGPQ